MHYRLWQRNGDPLARKRPAQIARPSDGLCTIPGCGKPVVAKALCGSHYYRLVRYGDATYEPAYRRSHPGEGNYGWKGEEASYSAKHHRIRTARGRAADYPCIWAARGDCKGRIEWASQTGDLDNVNDFAPMCSRHHKLLDLGLA